MALAECEVHSLENRQPIIWGNSAKAEEITAVIAYYVSMVAFSVVENTGFTNIINVLDPQHTTTSRTLLARIVLPALCNKIQEQIGMEL